jgi:hypothetical protein
VPCRRFGAWNGPAEAGLCCGPSPGHAELGKARGVSLNDDIETLKAGGERARSVAEPWRPEDDWGPISAAVIFFIILCALIVYGSGVYL